MAFFLYAVLAILTYVFYKLRERSKKLNYFKDRGIPQIETNIFDFGEDSLVKEKLCPGENTKVYYDEFKKRGEKHVGGYSKTSRFWIPIDPDLVKAVLIKDFPNFSAHHGKLPVSGAFFHNLFHMDGEEWKNMRRKLTPTFTSGKMKMMFNMIAEKTSGLALLVDEMSKLPEPTEIKGLLSRFTTDVIGTCGFGIDCNSIEDKNSEFYHQGQAIFEIGMPRLKTAEHFFKEVVKETLRYREENKVIRKDFVHLMIQLKNKGAVTEVTNENEDIYEKTVTEEGISFEDIAGQCIFFFTAGFETSSTTMSFALLELTQNQDVQEKLRKEVREVLKKHNGKLTYDAVQDMTYCDWVIHETLRKYPPVASLPRLCTKTFTIPGTNCVIEKGTEVKIPALGLQRDPEYWPEPEKFKPERFSSENKSKIRDCTFIPFGEGPRMCLGMRFGLMQSKAGIASLVNKFNFTLDEKTPYPPKFETHSFTLTVEGGIWLNATKAA